MKYLSLSVPGYGNVTPKNIPSASTDVDLARLANFTLNLLLAAGAILAIIFFLYGAIIWITSGGDKQKLEQAKHILTYTIVGLIVIAVSFLIIRLLGQILGSELLRNFGNFIKP